MRVVVAALLLLSALPARADHTRIDTPHGPLHAFRPDGYDAKTAGVVIYVHGWTTTVDQAWKKHDLPGQFTASGLNALFLAPEAPAGPDEDPTWDSPGDVLRAAEQALGSLPAGPLVVAGHSAAWRTIVPWLDYGPLDDVILLDALYGSEEDFRRWLDERRGHAGKRLTLVVEDTAHWTDPFAKHLAGVVDVAKFPARWADLDAAARRARVLVLRSQVDHMTIVTGGKVLPLALRRAPIPAR